MNTTINTTINTNFTLLWGIFIFLLSALLFSLSANSNIAIFYIFISMFCGVFLIVFRKDVPLFSPIFMLFSSIFINIGFPALYLLLFPSNAYNLNDEILKTVSVVYLIYFFSAALPVFFANQMFTPIPPPLKDELLIQPIKKPFSPFNPFKINFGEKNITFYFFISFVMILCIVFLLLQKSGFSYLEALKNPLGFRFEASAGILAYARKIIVLLFIINTFLLSRLSFAPEHPYKISRSLVLKLFCYLHILMLAGFALISGSRSLMLLPVISSIAVFCFYRKIKISSIFKIVFIFVLVIFAMNFYSSYRNKAKLGFESDFPNLAASSTYSAMEKTGISDKMLSLQALKRIDNYKNSLYFFEYIDREYNTIYYFRDFHILEQIKSHFLQPFPRNYIKDKGYYFSSLMTEKVFNSDVGEEKITYNFGGISNAFWNLGVAGVAIEGLLLGVAVVWLHRRFLEFINYDGFFMFFAATFFFIPNSIIVDGFWNTMDACGYFLNLAVVGVILLVLSFRLSFKKDFQFLTISKKVNE